MKLFAHFLLVFLFLSGPSPTRAVSSSSPPIKSLSTVTDGTSSNYLGCSIKSAGDIDKDGYPDVIVGAYGKNTAYVIYGGPSFTISIPVTGLLPATTGFTITGNAPGDAFGYSVSGAGDINNDGYDDIIIGAPNKNARKGTVYVIYGGERATMVNIDLAIKTLLPATTGFTVTGAASTDEMGCSVSSAGDINKDGYDDILIGAHFTNTYRGTVYVIYGGPKASMSDINLSNDILHPSSTGFKVTGNANFDWFGSAVSGGGDINNDGYDDIMIGSFYKNNMQGAVYVIYGGEESTMANIDLSNDILDPSTTGFAMFGTASSSFGVSVSNAGDVNNDGFADIVIGANRLNTVYVIYGGEKSAMTNLDFSLDILSPATTGFTIAGGTNEYFGTFVSSAGDINNDGFKDVIIGAYGRNSDMGAAYVVYGAQKSGRTNIDLTSTLTVYPATIIFSIIGDVGSGKLGISVGFSDITGDGFSEILIGAPAEINYKGNAYILIYHQCSTPCQTCDFPSSSTCTSCSPGSFSQGSQCVACPSNCMSCSTGSTCQACFSSYFLYQDGCFNDCPSETYAESQICKMCSDTMVDCMECTSASMCTLCIGGKMIYRDHQCVAKCPPATFITANKCIDCPLGCSKCQSDLACSACFDGYTLTGPQGAQLCVLKQPQPQIEIEEKDSEKAAAGVFEGTSLIGASLSSGSSLPLNFGMVAKILRNFKYLDMTVSTELQETFVSWKVASGFMSAPDSWREKFPAQMLPRVFSRYGLHSAFLINFWKPLMMALIGLALFGIFKALEVAMTGSGQVKGILKQVNIAASNFALTQFYSNLDDILFYFILEVRSTEFKGGFYIFSWVLAVILLLVGGALVFLHYIFVGKYQGVKSSSAEVQNFALKCENVKLIFKDFKDQTSLTQSFLMVNVIRSVISSLLFATLFEYPLVQISFFLVLNILMIVYLCSKRPFKEFSDTCGQVFCEIILLLAIISAFFMGLFDHAESYPVNAIKGLSKFIIILNFILLFGCAILMLVNIGKMLYKSYQQRKGMSDTTLKNMKINKRIDENSIITTTKFTRPTTDHQMNDLSHSEYDNMNGNNNNSIITTTKFIDHQNDLSSYHNINGNDISGIYAAGEGTGAARGGEFSTHFYHQNMMMMINGPNEVNFETNKNEGTKRSPQKLQQQMEESFEQQSYGDIVLQQRGSQNSLNHSRRLGNHHRIKRLILEGPRVEGNKNPRNRSNN